MKKGNNIDNLFKDELGNYTAPVNSPTLASSLAYAKSAVGSAKAGILASTTSKIIAGIIAGGLTTGSTILIINSSSQEPAVQKAENTIESTNTSTSPANEVFIVDSTSFLAEKQENEIIKQTNTSNHIKEQVTSISEPINSTTTQAETKSISSTESETGNQITEPDNIQNEFNAETTDTQTTTKTPVVVKPKTVTVVDTVIRVVKKKKTLFKKK